ncbi:MAG: dihydroorotate dehydrogenase [Planctomycetota bacterium]
MPTESDRTRVNIAGLELRNPVVLAAGTAGTLDEMSDAFPLARIGAVVTKSITPEPREGNDAWRVSPVKAGMLNAIGLANPGIEAFVEQRAPRIPAVGTPVIASAAGFTPADYAAVCRGFAPIDTIAAVEMNVSCPNTEHKIDIGADPGLLAEAVAAAKREAGARPLIVKLPPISIGTPHTIVDLARAAVDAGADALTLCNTTPAMAIDVETKRPRLANRHGGLSGPAVHPIAVRLIDLVYRELAKERGVPIMGLGGVLTWDDAAQFVLAGANAVQVGTASFVHPRRALRIAAGLEKWTRRENASIADLAGAVDGVRR